MILIVETINVLGEMLHSSIKAIFGVETVFPIAITILNPSMFIPCQSTNKRPSGIEMISGDVFFVPHTSIGINFCSRSIANAWASLTIDTVTSESAGQY